MTPGTLTPLELARELRTRALRIHSEQLRDEVRENALRVLVEESLRNFEQGTTPDDVPGARSFWQPLKRPRTDGSTRPLVKTGRLRAAVAQMAAGQPVSQPFNSARLVAEVPYAVFHQWGTRTIPARRFWGVGRRVRIRLAPAVAQWLVDWMWRDPGGLGA
jgi:phage gpG-like protein